MMQHPSMGNNHGDDEEPELPDGVTTEKLDALIREVIEKTSLIGLYAEPMVQVHGHSDMMFVAMRFDIGQLAWVKRVQNPVQAEFDDKLRTMEAPMVKDQTQNLKDRFLDE